MTEFTNSYEWTKTDQASYSAKEKFFEGKFLEEDLMDSDDLCPCGCNIGRSGWRLPDYECAVKYAIEEEELRKEIELIRFRHLEDDEECRANMEDRYFY